jgi:hypothetical protein
MDSPTRVREADGIPIGVNDKHGKPIHIGDTLRFDEKEWGAPRTFTITLDKGEILGDGAPSDWPEFCEIIRKYDAPL